MASAGTVPENAQTIWNYLVSHGLSANATAGIEGNIEQESGGSATAGVWPDNYGLIQWTPASNYFGSPPSLDQQLPAIIQYINANGSVSDINAHASSPQSAALWFSQNYERPLASAANNPNRESSAGAVAQAAQSGNWPSSSAAASTTGLSIPNPLNLIPGLSGIGDIFSGPFESILSWVGKHALSAVGVPSVKDALQRLGLILLGVALLLVGIHVLASGSNSQGNVPQEIDLIQQYQSRGKKTAKSASKTKAVESTGSKVGASEALEAAAVALCLTQLSLMVMVLTRLLTVLQERYTQNILQKKTPKDRYV